MKTLGPCLSLLAAVVTVGLVLAVDPLVDLGYTQLQGVSQQTGATEWLGVRYAAPPVGDLRFAAPVDPPTTTGVVDATQFQPICLAGNPSDFTMQPSTRFNVSEDCLYLNIFAPSNATTGSKLPVMYFIQGGGFRSNSNMNFNGSALAMLGNMIVVQINYRVGPFGFLQSEEVNAGGSLNNGLKDQIQGLVWLKKHAPAFGGDSEHMVAVGDSAGATSIALLLAAWAENDPGLIKGAIMESASVATLRTLDQGQEQYNCLLNATNCTNSADTLACLRSVDASDLQTEQCQFNPHIDNDIVKMSMLASFANGSYLKIPTIAGSCTDEGTKNVPRDTDTVDAALQFVNSQAFGVLSEASLELVRTVYLEAQEPVFPNSGRLWRQLSNADGDFRAHCITAALQDAMARDGVMTYNYRYGVLDPEQEQLGFGTYHTVELNGVFGPNNTDGAPPRSYRTTNAPIVPITMAYWASFVQTLDPNALRMEGTPVWVPWSVEGTERLLFQTSNITMETMTDQQKGRCAMFGPMLPAMETPAATRTEVELLMPGSPFRPGGQPTVGDAADGNGENGQGNGDFVQGDNAVTVSKGTVLETRKAGLVLCAISWLPVILNL